MITNVLIAGGGLAGTAAAIQLGRLGISTELFERESFPKEKVCGEGLMPAGVAALERLGLTGMKGAPFNGVRYHFGKRIAEGRFPQAHGVPCLGRGLRRLDLDHTLFELAGRTSNVKVHTGAFVEAPLVKGERVVGLMVNGTPRYADLIIGADGARSRLRHALKLDLPSRRKRFGIGAHFRLEPGRAMPQSVDVYLGRGYELYATPLPRGELVVAGLASAEALDGRLEDQFRRWWIAQPHLSERLKDAEQLGEMRAISPVSGRARQRYLRGFLLLGDAAGFTDPITGGGMTQALLSAELLRHYVARNARTTSDWLPEFDREREALLRDYRRLTVLLLWLARNPAFLGMSLGAMRLLPRLFSHLLGVAGCTHRLWSAESAYCIPALAAKCNTSPVLLEQRGDRAA
jgi:2-polyprenyl-6-methoxyphenol hydroxylase-like FAD-dependent oxidoreductase